jgi:hypothetical protein
MGSDGVHGKRLLTARFHDSSLPIPTINPVIEFFYVLLG